MPGHPQHVRSSSVVHGLGQEVVCSVSCSEEEEEEEEKRLETEIKKAL